MRSELQAVSAYDTDATATHNYKTCNNSATRIMATMHAAQVSEWGKPPTYVEITKPAVPPADSGLVQIQVTAMGVHRVVRSRAAGQHYSAKSLPHLPGTDGVGTTPDGQQVFFSNLGGGSFSEFVNVPKAAVVPLATGADPIQYAALVNPAFSSWMALTQRCTTLPPGFSVVVMGATSASGRLAVHFARTLGAGKVIGCARDQKALAEAGLDETIVLADPVESTDFSKAENVDVILDYMYGPPVVQLLKALKPTKPVQYVQIGSLAALDFSLPSEILRSKDITMRGSGPGSWGLSALGKELPSIVKGMVAMKPQQVNVVPLKDIETAWDAPVQGRLVFVP